MILEAQKHTKSNMAAARWMGVCYTTYRKWAKYYKVFEQKKPEHLTEKQIAGESVLAIDFDFRYSKLASRC